MTKTIIIGALLFVVRPGKKIKRACKLKPTNIVVVSQPKPKIFQLQKQRHAILTNLPFCSAKHVPRHQ